jgi:hypothetical protein
MDQRIINLYDDFTHGGLSRRELLDRLAQLAGGAAAAATLLAVLQNDYAHAAIVDENDPRLATETASYDAAGTKVSGYLARLKGGGKRPAVLVIHENRGLNPHIKDVARSTTPGSTNASTPASRLLRRRSRSTARATSSTSTRARSTPSTTTRTRPATTRPRPTSPGAAPSRS